MDNKTIFYRPLKRRDEYEKDPETNNYYKYSHYREVIAEDCQYRCVYCDCHEDDIGGREAMELDHFRPWNKGFGEEKIKKFEHLKHEPNNLVHACGACNSFKWAHWPTENPELCYDSEKGWIEPFQEARSEFLEVAPDGTVNAVKPPGAYQIATLRLNRPLLKRIREFRILRSNLSKLEEKLRGTIQREPNTPHAETAKQVLEVFSTIRRICSFP